MSKLKEIIMENKSKAIIILLLFVFSIVMILVSSNRNENKVFKNQKYIYTSETNNINGFTSKLPYINIEGDNITILNKEIATKYYTENILKEKYADYEYYNNKNILSLLVKYQYLEAETPLSLEIYFYNIDINTGNLLTNNELLNIYNVTESEVENKLLEYIEEYYNYEINNNYLSNYTLSEYKNAIGNNILDNINYYVKDNSLYAYKYFQTDEMLAYDTNAPFELFRFKIK